jgi:hypothetical protein
MAKVDITIPTAALDDFKALPGYEIKDGETDAKYAKRLVKTMVRRVYRDAKHASLWEEAKDFIQGNFDSIV